MFDEFHKGLTGPPPISALNKADQSNSARIAEDTLNRVSDSYRSFIIGDFFANEWCETFRISLMAVVDCGRQDGSASAVFERILQRISVEQQSSHRGRVDDHTCYELLKDRIFEGKQLEARFSQLPGLNILRQVCSTIYGDSANSIESGGLTSFSALLHSGSAVQAQTLRQSLEDILAAVLSEHNCLRILYTAHSCRSESIAGTAARIALSDFSRAAISDPTGLVALPMPMLIDFVESDSLCVFRELDVFHAIEAWVSANIPERKDFLPILLGRGLRFGKAPLITLEDIVIMDSSRAVATSGAAIKFVADMFVRTVTSMPINTPSLQKPRIRYLS